MKFTHYWKPLVALTAIVIAFGLTFAFERNGLDLNIDGSARAQEVRAHETYDLSSLRVMHLVLQYVNDRYVDHERKHPRRMFLAGLNGVQRAVAPVMIDYEDGSSELVVQVNTERRTFRVDDLNAVWDILPRIREVFGFLQENLRDDESTELRDIEYAAINGMLRTLDPHSVLLTPEIYEEMRMSTRGQFGGLGIVISLRDGQLTIIRPMEDTPAGRAGLQRMDRIVQIGEESTLNMPLTEAVNRLRGAPGSPVTIWVVREGQGGWRRPRRFNLTRAVIRIDSVESRMLGDGIGYIRIKSFQGNTHDDMTRALAQLHREASTQGHNDGVAGLVLDLRDNPGGLLDQAVRIADTFLSSGTIVTTSGNGATGRDAQSAHAEGTERNYPMIVLVNGGSASASEIVAGALKNHDRALIVGQRTFGKGSVQVLYDIFDGSALKLTISQYLTPGNVSIQGVGVTPDIALDPITIDRDDMDLAVNREYVREADLALHLTNERAREAERPSAVMRYYLPTDVREELRNATPEDRAENRSEEEFLLAFSRRVLSETEQAGRRRMLRESEGLIERENEAQLRLAVEELTALGVDWSEGPDEGPSPVTVEVSTNATDNVAQAGAPFELRVRVTNTGEATLHQLRASTESDFTLFQERELIFGRLAPGETREWSTVLGTCSLEDGERRCRLPPQLSSRADAIRLQFSEQHGHAPEDAELRTEIRALARPQFSYQWQFADNLEGNGDGSLQRGEQGTLFVRLRNTGEGRTYTARATLRNRSGEGVLLRAGRFEIDNLQPGQERNLAFTFQVLPDFAQESLKLDLSIVDTDLREIVSERLELPIAGDPSTPVSPQRGRVVLRDGAVIRSAPTPGSSQVAHVADGALRLPSEARYDGFVRVEIAEDHPAWVSATDISDARPERGARIVEDLNRRPPVLTLDPPSLVTREESLHIAGSAQDETLVRDVYIYVGTRKVFYQSNAGSDTPGETRFDTSIPLRPGINYVTVTARENNQTVSRRTFVVRRDGPDGALLETPPHADDLTGLGHQQ